MTGSEDKPHRHKSKMELIMMKTGAREQDNVILFLLLRIQG